MNQINLLMTRSGDFTEEEMAAMGIVLIVIGIIVMASLLGMVIMHIASAIPYFIMARKAGSDHAWLAFIPYGQQYVAMTLPHREFNIFNKFKTNNRKKAFWAYIIISAITVVINTIMDALEMVQKEIEIALDTSNAGAGLLAGLLVVLLVSLVCLAVSLAATFANCMIKWRTWYDILNTYKMEQHAMWASIVSLFFPIIMVVFSYIIMNTEPDYGFGNYYVTEDAIVEE